jgi:hypothetical protein
MNLNQIIEEIYDSGGGNYPAYSEPPRKDFAPMSNRGGYENPYQRGGAHQQPTDQTLQGQPSMPWPLQTLNDDITDSFVFLTAAMTKMIQAVKGNPTLDKKMKEELLVLYKKSKVALNLLKEIGLSATDLNMARPQPVQNPVPINPDQAIDPKTLPNPNPMIAIKLP